MVTSPSTAIEEGDPPEEYVYALNVKGGSLYRISHKTSHGKKETVKEEVRRMELISPGSVLHIEEGASVSLTCAGCNVLNLNHKDSPYTVKMADFRKDRSIVGEVLTYFTAALVEFVYPDSKPREVIKPRVRGANCEGVWPPDGSEILSIGAPITLRWELRGPDFFVQIREMDTKKTIYSVKISSNRIDVPAAIFKPGEEYEWGLSERETGGKRRSCFAIISSQESEKILQILHEIQSLLPPEADSETRTRLQAGYLCSEGLIYDAWQWLERNGISQ
jgi:hypothetical protein